MVNYHANWMIIINGYWMIIENGRSMGKITYTITAGTGMIVC